MKILGLAIMGNEIPQEYNGEKVFKRHNSIQLRMGKILRRIPVFRTYNINKGIKNIEANTIIVFDNGRILDKYVLQYIAENNQGKRLIFYYWNPISTAISPDCVPKAFEVWSYSTEDCKKYGLKYNSTFYCGSYTHFSDTEIHTDVSFLGKDKGRREVLNRIREELKKSGLIVNYYITATHPRFQKKGYQHSLPYTESLKISLSSKAILDYYMDPNAGLSLRPMEALFNDRKLITNNATIKNYDFYHENNILVIEDGDYSGVKAFLERPYAPINQDIKDYYLFENWVMRF